jgi:hypothetical protein
LFFYYFCFVSFLNFCHSQIGLARSAGRKRKIPPEENGLENSLENGSGENESVEADECREKALTQCGVMSNLTKRPCKMNIPCQHHSSEKNRYIKNPPPVIMTGTNTHVGCFCTNQDSARENKIWRKGTSDLLLPESVRNFLREDLAQKGREDFAVYFEETKVKRRDKMSNSRKKYTLGTLKIDCKGMGYKLPSKSSKQEAVVFYLTCYEAELKLRLSHSFEKGTLKDWNCDSLVQIAKVQWRKKARHIEILYGTWKK